MSSSLSVVAYLGVGSNVEPEQNLRLAWHELRKLGDNALASNVYRNPPVGFSGDDFLNLVVRIDTTLSPPQLLQSLETIHDLAGRKRGSEKFGPRELDVDLLMYGDIVSREWKLPRKDIMKYPFVLQPMAELAPELAHPGNGFTMHALWDDMRGTATVMERVAFAFDP